MSSSLGPVEPGQIRRNRLLETEAVYRVVSVADDVVEVEVVRAPGLKEGQRFSFTQEAVAAMELAVVPEATQPTG
jgi:hypothetical protein